VKKESITGGELIKKKKATPRPDTPMKKAFKVKKKKKESCHKGG